MQMKSIFCVVFFTVGSALSNTGFAQDEKTANNDIEELKQQVVEMRHQIEELEKQHTVEIKGQESKDETDYLRRLAESITKEEESEVKPAGETVFTSGELSLQALNPEISVTGDMLGYYKHQADTRKRSDFIFRGLGLHFEAYLDPYSRFKAAVPISEDGAELGEAYYTRFGILDGVNLTLGKFRQQFGVVNRWHKHALDQVDFPLALRKIFGEGGLNQTGASVDLALPTRGEVSQELTFQVTDSENDRLFGGDTLGNPCLLLHYKNYRDLSDSTYLECGLTGLFGWNDEWETGSNKEHDALGTQVFGADLTLSWEPVERMRYRNIEWRSEVYVLNRDIVAPDGSGRDNLNAWGSYSYVQSKVSRTLDIGIRGDYYKPDCKDYAGASLEPLAYASANAYRWQIGPYITWHQSPFVEFRVECDHADGHRMEEPEDVLWLQMIFAAGPHKHERY
jgi:hypothetical protein